ncbi:MAG TPA: glycosyltransferase family 39 protein, partial [Steroidobacteraceae bacterium]|nr:glycosyltransferase family 39 protein [Steroidobacteraceae bacterium]
MLPWLVAVLALLLLVYALSLSASFQFDDWQVVVRDPRVQSLSAWWHSMPGMRALTKLSYALNHEWSSRAEAFRVVNVALHALNTALVFVFVRTMAQRLGNPPDGRATAVAVLTALVFALHPVQTESVTYIAARPNLIATLFSLASLVAWLKGRERHTNGWWSLATLCFIAALAGKETAAVLPLAMLLCLAAEHRLSVREAAFPLGLCGLFGLLLVAVWAHFPYDYLVRTSLATRGPL